MKRHMFSWLVMLVLVLAACAPAATPTSVVIPTETPTPRTEPTATRAAVSTPMPTATVAPTPMAVTAQPKRGGVLRFNVRGDPPLFDPWRRLNSDIYDLTNYVHPRLSRTSSSSEPCSTDPVEAELATGWRWVNDTTLEIDLRQGVKFAPGPPYNGREFTADDLLYTATVQWAKSGDYVPVGERLTGVGKVDRYRVRFSLKQPFGDMVEAVVQARRLPVAGPELFGPDGSLGYLEQAGLGPFRITRYVPGVKVELLRNDSYWRQGIPYLDGLTALVMPDFAMVGAAVRAGKLDFAELKGQMAQGEQLSKSNPELQIVWCEALSPIHLTLPTDTPPFNDVRVRRAIAMAIDREALGKVNWGDKGLPAFSIVGPAQEGIVLSKQGFPAEVRQYLEYHPDRARSLLAEAGFPQGFPMSINLTRQYRDHVVSGETIVGMLGKVGITVKLIIQDFPAFTASARQGRYESTMIYFVSDEGNMKLQDRHSAMPPNVNYWRIKDPGLDTLLEAFGRESDTAKRKEIARNIQIRSAEQALSVPIGVGLDPSVHQPWVKGMPPKMKSFVMGDYVMYAWLDK